MQVFHLPHDVWCRDRCACEEVTTVAVAENRRTGERARQQLTKKVPGSITFVIVIFVNLHRWLVGPGGSSIHPKPSRLAGEH